MFVVVVLACLKNSLNLSDFYKQLYTHNIRLTVYIYEIQSKKNMLYIVFKYIPFRILIE